MRTRSSCRNSGRPRLRNETGSSTLEAALIIPLAAILVTGIIYCIAASAQLSLVYITAGKSADRMAHTWDNSFKHPVTGMYSTLTNDPLYWRWIHDGAADWFVGLTGTSDTVVLYPVEGEGGATSALPLKKLSKGADLWPSAYHGTGSFERDGFARQIRVAAEVPLFLPHLMQRSNAASGNSAESIAEPAEYIRNIELVLGFLPSVKTKLTGDTLQNTMSPWLNKQGVLQGRDTSLTFPHHAEAVKYVRALVHGKEQRIGTVETGSWRLIDAMDKHLVAHQTYIGPKTTNQDVMNQLVKDAELLRRGEVNGVVWHFFRRTGETASGPSPSLKQMLEKHGIIVVIHS